MSKTQGHIILPSQHLPKESDISKAYIMSTDRSAGGKSDRSHLKMLDNSALLPPRREQSASLRMKMPPGVIPNDKVHKTIDDSK